MPASAVHSSVNKSIMNLTLHHESPHPFLHCFIPFISQSFHPSITSSSHPSLCRHFIFFSTHPSIHPSINPSIHTSTQTRLLHRNKSEIIFDSCIDPLSDLIYYTEITCNCIQALRLDGSRVGKVIADGQPRYIAVAPKARWAGGHVVFSFLFCLFFTSTPSNHPHSTHHMTTTTHAATSFGPPRARLPAYRGLFWTAALAAFFLALASADWVPCRWIMMRLV